MNERYTDLFFTINTHLMVHTLQQQQLMANKLKEILLEKFYTKEGLTAALIMEEGGSIVSATMTNAAVEVGDKYHQLHIHFNLTVLHKGKLLLKNDDTSLNKRVRDWWNQHLPRKCYASVDLLDSSKAKNYNLKRQQGGKGSVENFSVEPANSGAEEREDLTGTGGGDSGDDEADDSGEGHAESSRARRKSKTKHGRGPK